MLKSENEQAYVCPECRRVLVACVRLTGPPWCLRCNKRMTPAAADVQPGQMVLFKGRG